MTSPDNNALREMPAHHASLAGLLAAPLRRGAVGVGFALLALAATAQQKAGEVARLQGMATAQQPGAPLRFLGRGDSVLEGDVLTTTDKGFAVVALADGSKFTLRPSTTFALERFSQTPGAESSIMRLFKGGMRMVSGLVGKRNPTGVELRVSTATIGIRGTSFDARICGDDCRQENLSVAAVKPQPAAPAAAPALGPIIARVVQSSGNVAANQPGQPARPLGVGAPLYEGDDVRTGAGGVAVIGFRDQSKVSVNPQSALRIDGFVYNKPNTDDNMALSLLRGGLRVFTGLIGKKANNAFSVKTRTSTIGIRGTGMDISCEGPCVDQSVGGPTAPGTGPVADPKQPDGLFMYTWEGGAYFGGGCALEVPLGQAGFAGPDCGARLLATVPDFFTDFGSPRPDTVEIDWENLFATVASTGADGLYLLVRDGHVFIADRSRIDLGVGEAGYLGADGQARRLSPVPGFLTRDPYPIPELSGESDQPILQLFGVTLGQPGQDICVCR